jgi:hypothetical protein
MRRSRAVMLVLGLALVACSAPVTEPQDGSANDGAPSVSRDGDAPDVQVDGSAPSLDASTIEDSAALSSDARDGSSDAANDRDAATPCPSDMALVGATCVDLYEAPNVRGALALVMYTFDESEAWCRARGKRLCFDDEWAAACGGSSAWRYPYGNTHRLGVCNDEETYRAYNQSLLNQWPASASGPNVSTLSELFTRARTTASASAAHVEAIYQGEPSGSNAGCTNASGVFDTLGNIEEWTRRRDGGATSFHGKLKGRYWGNERVGPSARDTTCQGGVTTHGDAFRFYEIGFRCCRTAG